IRASPSTSSQSAWNAGCQAECDQHQIGSPPSHCHPGPPPQMAQNVSDALRNHPPVPVDQYPDIPHHLIECHDVQRMHHLHSPPPPPMFLT
ncbi:hypothetical protein J3R82DRAFT_3006, partial [Butyriboletus roseoflavus]